MKQKRFAYVYFLLAAAVLLLILFSLGMGQYPVPAKEAIGMVIAKVRPEIQPFWDRQAEIVFFNIRLPRILLALLVGCCLSAAGAAYQGIFKNPMAAPDILGASAGAAFGACMAILFRCSGRMITAAAFFGGLLSIAAVYLIHLRIKGNQITGLLLSGIMINSLFQSGTSYIKLTADPNDQLPAITYWLMGSFSGTKVSDIQFVILPMLLGLIPLFLLRWRIDLLTMGETEAKSMGIHAKLLRVLLVLCATLITAASVSVSGTIGWVGLVIPNLVRRFAGNSYRRLMPACMLFGAGFLLLIDDISRTLATSEIPISILTAVIGAPFFIFLFAREEAS